jgi:molybdenum cofactor biosynthesis protein B
LKYTGHSKKEKIKINAVIITISTSRYKAIESGRKVEDPSGDIIEERLVRYGVDVKGRETVKDDLSIIRSTIKKWLRKVNLIITTGGTGISPSDTTIEAIKPMLDKELTLFPTLFALYSLADVGTSVLLSRTIAGVIGKTLIFCLPGSRGAVSLATEKIILPELGHLINMLYGLE